MEYYILKEAVDTEETGHAYPQVEFKNPKKLKPNPCLAANMTKEDEYLSDDIPPFDYLELARGAKLTDMMTSPFTHYNGFLISEKLKNLFEGQGVKDCRYYSVKLFKEDLEIKNYYYFHSGSCLRKYIDYKESKFFISKRGQDYVQYINGINSYDELEKISSTLDLDTRINAEQFYFKSNFPYSQPLFRLFAFNYNFFITNKLKEVIEIAGVTGLRILSAKDLIKTPNLS